MRGKDMLGRSPRDATEGSWLAGALSRLPREAREQFYLDPRKAGSNLVQALPRDAVVIPFKLFTTRE